MNDDHWTDNILLLEALSNNIFDDLLDDEEIKSTRLNDDILFGFITSWLDNNLVFATNNEQAMLRSDLMELVANQINDYARNRKERR